MYEADSMTPNDISCVLIQLAENDRVGSLSFNVVILLLTFCMVVVANKGSLVKAWYFSAI